MKGVYEPVIEMAHHYAKATGVSVRVFDEKTQEIYHEQDDWLGCRHCIFGKTGQNHPVSGCSRSQVLAIAHSKELGGSQVYGCRSGFIFWVSPIVVDGHSFASVVAGMQVSHQALSGDRGQLPKNASEVFQSLEQSQRDKVLGLTEILTLSSQAVSQQYKDLTLTQEVSTPFLDHIVRNTSLRYELLKAFSEGYQGLTKEILNQLIQGIWRENNGDLEATKKKVLSLFFFLKGGLSIESVGIGIPFGAELAQARDSSDLLQWFIMAMNSGQGVTILSEGKSPKPSFDMALTYIAGNLNRRVNLGEVAAYLGLSEAYFSRLFKSEMGVGFVDYLNGMRVSQASRLLKSSHKGLGEIAQICGFADQSYFTKIFKKIKGVSPGRYRRSLTS